MEFYFEVQCTFNGLSTCGIKWPCTRKTLSNLTDGVKRSRILATECFCDAIISHRIDLKNNRREGHGIMERLRGCSLQQERVSERAALPNIPPSTVCRRDKEVGGSLHRNKTFALTRLNINLILGRKTKTTRNFFMAQDDSDGFEVLLVPTQISPKTITRINSSDDSIDVWKSQLKTVHGISISDILGQVYNAHFDSTTMIALTTDINQETGHHNAVIIKGEPTKEKLTDDSSTTLSTMATRISNSGDSELELIIPKTTRRRTKSKRWSSRRKELWMTSSYKSVEKSDNVMEMVFFESQRPQSNKKEEIFYMQALPRARTMNW